MASRIRIWFNQHFGCAQPFTLDQFVGDCRDNMAHVLSSKLLKSTFGTEFKAFVHDRDEVNAGVSHAVPEQILIYLNIGLLKACYGFLIEPTRSYYARHAHVLDVDAHLFARMCLGACGLMAFWHEFAHAVRGHLAYKKASGQLVDACISEAYESSDRAYGSDETAWIPLRILELDADIYGAQFLLSQVAVARSRNPNIHLATFAHCYAIGLRGLFQVLNGLGCPHDDASGSTHPNPISRAYTAFTHGMARVSEMKLSVSDQATMLAVGQTALLDFEVNDLGQAVDPEVLKRFAHSELQLWREREAELFEYRLRAKNNDH